MINPLLAYLELTLDKSLRANTILHTSFNRQSMNGAAVRCAARTLPHCPGQRSGDDPEATVFLAPVGSDPAGGISSAVGIRDGVAMLKLVLNSNSRRGNKTCARASNVAAKITNNNKHCFTAILRARHVSCLPTIKSFFSALPVHFFSLLSTSLKNSRARASPDSPST